jgi:hypothetical protein
MMVELLRAAEPTEWPRPPPEMSYSTLGDIEGCPRRWALGHAAYSGLWDGPGYPPKISLANLPGTVVHLALEDAISSLIRAGCASVEAPEAPAAIRSRGGYTAIVGAAIEKALGWFALNPRAHGAREYTARVLRGQVPELRSRVQGLLARVRLATVRRDPSSPAQPRARRAICAGVFPELTVRAPTLGWKGKIDLLVIDDAACEIVDFKTGAAKPDHIAQLRTYAVLWRRDPELNPNGRLATRLTVAYSSSDVSVPGPSEADLVALEADLRAHTAAARADVGRVPPPARPAPDVCGSCGVRHLCREYWTADTQRLLSGGAPSSAFSDAQLAISGVHGSSSWDALVQVGPPALAGKEVLLRTGGHAHHFDTGAIIRVANAHVAFTVDDEPQPPVLTLGMFSEAFRVR